MAYKLCYSTKGMFILMTLYTLHTKSMGKNYTKKLNSGADMLVPMHNNIIANVSIIGH